MHIVELVAGLAIVVGVAWDAFATVLLPRRVSTRLRLSGAFFEASWGAWTAIGRRLSRFGRGESYLGMYALLALVALFALWATSILLGYSLIYMSFGDAFHHPGAATGFGTDLYLSGTTLFTLGIGDVTPATSAARVAVVTESALGLTFLALVISYLPVLYQSFSRR
ncbi:MAG TPA: potassium channel family protein, partial [Acidimicrobiales bacterium]|nr:potassium channel family protein [Acidimicrobiales bacterium]